jgi:nucleotide-binding universal stress UspA family protein
MAAGPDDRSMFSHPILAAYEPRTEADDGLALARYLAELTDSDLLVVRVMEDMVEQPVPGLDEQSEVRERMGETRRAVFAVVPGQRVELMPALDPSLARALHGIAEAQNTALITLGSSHRHGIGRLLLGGSAETVVNGAPCPVAVAPPGYAMSLDGPPVRILAAYDGTHTAEAALAFACDLATVGSLPLGVISVRAPWGRRPVGSPLGDGAEGVLQRGLERAESLVEDRVAVDGSLLTGDPGERLSEAGGPGELLVMGSHQRGPVRRALLGSASTHVVRHAHRPVIVVPVPRHAPR